MPLSDLEQRVCRSLADRAPDLYADLEAHVATPTGQGYQPGLESYRATVAGRLERLGAAISTCDGRPRASWLGSMGVHLDEPDAPDDGPVPPILIARRSTDVRPNWLIAAHLDTVHDPESDFRTLTRDPDGVMTRGPGAVDMKGGIVIALAALEALEAHGVRPSWTFVANSDEETGSFQSAAALRAVVPGHDIGIALEPALPGGALAVERMGSGQFMIEVFGRSAHVGRAYADGVSAVTHLAGILQHISTMADPDAGRIVSVGPICGGQVVNAVPDHAAAWGNARFATPELGEQIGAELDALATTDDACPRVIVRRAWSRPAKPLTPEVEQFALHVRGVAEDLGQTLPFASTGGVCDGNILQDAGLPTLDTLGVRGGNLHRPDEFVEIDSLVERAQLLALTLARGGPAGF